MHCRRGFILPIATDVGIGQVRVARADPLPTTVRHTQRAHDPKGVAVLRLNLRDSFLAPLIPTEVSRAVANPPGLEEVLGHEPRLPRREVQVVHSSAVHGEEFTVTAIVQWLDDQRDLLNAAVREAEHDGVAVQAPRDLVAREQFQRTRPLSLALSRRSFTLTRATSSSVNTASTAPRTPHRGHAAQDHLALDPIGP
jgi:hypothetical protein